MTKPPTTQDDPAAANEQVEVVQLLPPEPIKAGRGMAITALVLSVVASTLALVAVGLSLEQKYGQKPAQSAEAIERQRVIDRAVDRLEKQMALLQAEGGQSGGDLSANPDLVARLGAIDARLSDLTAAQASPKIPSERLDRLNEDYQPLLASLTSIEQRLRHAEARLVRQKSAPRTSIVAASANIVAAVRAGTGFQPEITMLDRLARDDSGLRDMIQPLRPFAAQGIPTAASLAAMLDRDSAKALAAVNDVPDQAENWGQKLWRNLRGLISVRRVSGEIEGDDPAAMLARAVFRVQQSDLAAGLDLVARLPQPARQALAGWTQQAEERQKLEQAAVNLLARATDRAAAVDADTGGQP